MRRALTFGDQTVSDIMVPRTEMAALPTSITVAEAIDEIAETNHTRYPVYEEDVDNIVGYVHVKDLYRAPRDATLRRLLRPIGFIAETSNIELALQRFQSTRTPLAIVVDEHGGTAGIVTIQDVVEELIGEVQDEFDLEAPLVEDRGRRQLFGRRRRPRRLSWRTSLGLEVPEEGFPTLGGRVFEQLQRRPRVGDEAGWATSMPGCSKWTACASPGSCSPVSLPRARRRSSGSGAHRARGRRPRRLTPPTARRRPRGIILAMKPIEIPVDSDALRANIARHRPAGGHSRTLPASGAGRGGLYGVRTPLTETLAEYFHTFRNVDLLIDGFQTILLRNWTYFERSEDRAQCFELLSELVLDLLDTPALGAADLAAPSPAADVVHRGLGRTSPCEPTTRACRAVAESSVPAVARQPLAFLERDTLLRGLVRKRGPPARRSQAGLLRTLPVPASPRLPPGGRAAAHPRVGHL